MKAIKPTIVIGIAVLGLLFLISAKAKPSLEEYISIEKLMSSRKLESQIKGVGGYQEECIRFELANLTRDTLKILIESGRRLASEDTSIQDILIVKDKCIVLSPFEQKTVPGYGFCCQSSNAAPKKDAQFNIGQMASEDWITLTKIINENKFPPSAIQSAVWAVSNDHPVSAIHFDDMEAINLLRSTVSNIKGVELPWYSLTFEEDTNQLFSHKPERIIGNFKFYLKTTSSISIILKNKNGMLVKTLVENSMPGRGLHTYHINLPVKDWPKGEYEILVFEDYSVLNKKKKFKL